MVTRRFFVFCATFLLCASLFGQNNRSAVSINGSDLNSCTVPFPCRTFTAAMSMTNSGGEIIALDSGGYGPFTVNRAVTVRSVPGAYAGLAPTSGVGITVAAGVNDDVILRGLTVNGLGVNLLIGIFFQSGRSLHIENCAIDRITDSGIASHTGGRLFVSDTSVTNSFNGIEVGNGSVSSPTVFVTISNCKIVRSTNVGISVLQTGKATIINTVISNGNTGLNVTGPVAALRAEAVIESSTISGNSTGIASSAPAGTARTRVSNCTISHNSVGVSTLDVVNAPILSRQNNTLQENGTNGMFSGTFAAD